MLRLDVEVHESPWVRLRPRTLLVPARTREGPKQLDAVAHLRRARVVRGELEEALVGRDGGVVLGRRLGSLGGLEPEQGIVVDQEREALVDLGLQSSVALGLGLRGLRTGFG